MQPFVASASRSLPEIRRDPLNLRTPANSPLPAWQHRSEVIMSEINKAAANLVLRELSDIETRDIFGGTWGKVVVGPIQPVPPPPP
ncbi:MAG: hypothetical protein JNL89_12440, partial [Rhodanobacteraceae bacterium]|nr:hypothetical protein [Rhodanobacteraceae bacterium]